MTSNPDITSGRLLILPLALLEWLIIWLSRYIPVPIRNGPIRVLTQIAFGISVFGVWFCQGAIYQSIGGVRILGKDHFFMGLTLVEHGIGIGLMYRVAFERRKIEQENRRDRTRS